MSVRIGHLSLARWVWPSIAAVTLTGMLPTTAARADCTTTGPTTVSCTGTTTNYQPGTINGVTITVQSGAAVNGGTGGTEAIYTINATNSTVNNFGTINGPVSFVGSDNTFLNAGLFQITDPAANLSGHSISGDFTQTAAGVLKLRFDDAFFDQLLLTAGNATLDGKLIVVPQAKVYTAAVTYDFVRTIGGNVSGTFASVTAGSPFFTVSTDYSSGTAAAVTLTPIAFNAVSGLTPNQKAVADALTANFSGSVTGNAATLYSNLFAATSVGVFDQLSGQGTSATQGATFFSGSMFMSLLGQTPFGTAGTPAAPLGYAAADTHPAARFIRLKSENAVARRWQAWARGFGGTRSVDGESNPGTFANQTRAGGGAVGLIYRADPDLLIGGAVGISQSHFKVDDLATNGDLTTGHVGLHAAKRWGARYASAALTYAHTANDTTRTITGVGPAETATGRFGSDMLAGRMEMGWRHDLGRMAVTPFGAVQYSELWQRGYAEGSTTSTGAPGVLGLSYAAQAIASFPLTLGAQIDARLALINGQVLTPYARLAWVHEFKPDSRIDASFISVPGAAFTVAGARSARDAAQINAGAKLALNATTALTASLNSEVSERSRTIAATGGLMAAW